MIVKGFRCIHFCRSVNFRNKYGVLSSAMSTSFVNQSRDVKNSRATDSNEELLKEGRRKYEDTFGNIDNFEMIFQRVKDDPDDLKEYQRERRAQGKTFAQYIKEIKSHLDNFDYKSALKVLEVDMVNDKKPTNTFVYKVLISYNARIGNLKEAYRLFVNYKKRQGVVTGAMYTSMFNACANCSSSFLALEKAEAVEDCMRNNENHVINISNYNSMMKAYGRHGDMATCLKIMDEVLYKRDKVKNTTYSFLFQACVSDKNSGLRYALLLWRKMIQNRVKPSIFSFNLMLRCVRECSLGDALLIPNLIEEIQKESGKFFHRKVQVQTVLNKKKRIVTKIPSDGRDLIVPVENELFQPHDETVSYKSKESDTPVSEGCEVLTNNFLVKEVKHLNSGSNQLEQKKNAGASTVAVDILSKAESSLNEKEPFRSNLEDNPLTDELPNLLALQPSTGSVVKFGVLTEPHYRFMLVGGIKGYLKTMAEFGVKPDIKTFTLMLDVIPPTFEAEQELLSFAEAHKISLDTTFFNILMKRRFVRHEDSSVKDCLQQMHTLNLLPDLLTFGVLAMGCRTYDSGMDLLWNVKNYGYRVNTEILGALLKNASYARDANYVSAIIQAAKENDTKLCQKFIADLSEFVRREQSLRKEEEINRTCFAYWLCRTSSSARHERDKLRFSQKIFCTLKYMEQLFINDFIVKKITSY